MIHCEFWGFMLEVYELAISLSKCWYLGHLLGFLAQIRV